MVTFYAEESQSSGEQTSSSNDVNGSSNGNGNGTSDRGGIREEVSDYYSRVLQRSEDLQTNACTTAGAPPLHVRRALDNVHSDVLAKYYGCGFLAPDLLRGMRVLDLGCGSGRDCYVLAQLVGEHGRVVGVDMTEEQLAPARATIEWHRARFGYAKSNTTFLTGYIEQLEDPASFSNSSGSKGEENSNAAAGTSTAEEEVLEVGSFDVIVSNCVVNLSPDKEAVLLGAYRLLKQGNFCD